MTEDTEPLFFAFIFAIISSTAFIVIIIIVIKVSAQCTLRKRGDVITHWG